ncbi:MAG: DUF222 domain-containing protein [Nocardioidaceae bacterium]|nr:MAG: DUF222 domain-containing protein [Nocardioidaceae bacterium]
MALARAALEASSEAPFWSLRPDEQTTLLRQLTQLEAQVAQRRLALIAELDQVNAAPTHGCVNTAALVKRHCQMTGFTARHQVKLAVGLEAHEPTRVALEAGRVIPAQAAVIIEAIDRLPDDTPIESVVKAEEHLIDLALDHDAHALKVFGNRLAEVIDPDHADELLAEQLEAEERRAGRECFLRLRDDDAGSTHGSFKIPSLHGELLRTMLAALRNPDRPATSDDPEAVLQTGEDPLVAVRGQDESALPSYGAAFCELLERIDPATLPRQGGMPVTVIVTMPFQTLMDGHSPAMVLGSDKSLSPGLARRLACEAGVIPAVLGTGSEVLDLGRKARFFTAKQRLAATVSQQGSCAADDCTIPAAWCDAHHYRTPWAAGGSTDRADALLLCKRHHTLIHDPHIVIRTSSGGGKITFHRRT